LGVGSVLRSFFEAHGQPNAVPKLRDGNDVRVRLHNWSLLTPALATFGVDLTDGDTKVLLVAGDMDELLQTLYALSVRIGAATSWAAPAVQSLDGRPSSAAEPIVDKAAGGMLWKATGVCDVCCSSLVRMLTSQL
jgi:hypothetical protein